MIKKLTNNLSFLVYFFLTSMLFSCAAPSQPMGEEFPYIAKTFSKEYDEVWETVEEIVTDDLMIPIKAKDKENGVLKSDWVSIIRIRGTLRWNIKIILEKGDDKTTVKIYEHVEEPFNQKVEREKLKQKDKINTGWQKSKEKVPEVNEILNMLSARLGE